MEAQVVVATGLTSEEADELIASIKAPPSTATDVKKVSEGGVPERFTVQATFPAVQQAPANESNSQD
jgi:hypothetical protein